MPCIRTIGNLFLIFSNFTRLTILGVFFYDKFTLCHFLRKTFASHHPSYTEKKLKTNFYFLKTDMFLGVERETFPLLSMDALRTNLGVQWKVLNHVMERLSNLFRLKWFQPKLTFLSVYHSGDSHGLNFNSKSSLESRWKIFYIQQWKKLH